MSDSVRPHRRQPTRLPRTWDSPGKNTGVGCHFLLQCRKVKSKVKSLSRVRLLATPWTAAYQAPPPMGLPRQEYWSGVPLVECLLFTYMLRGTSLICICGLSAMGYFICIVSLNFHRKFTFIRVTNQPFSHFTK